MLTVEALHLGQLLASHGYIFPIDDHSLTMKNDNTLYRFQVRLIFKRIFVFGEQIRMSNVYFFFRPRISGRLIIPNLKTPIMVNSRQYNFIYVSVYLSSISAREINYENSFTQLFTFAKERC